MPNSVFSLLRTTLPIGTAIAAARSAARLSASAVLSPAQLAPFLKALPKDADLRPPAPPLVKPPPGLSGYLLDTFWSQATISARIWRFQHDGATPHLVTNLTARVRDTGYKTQTVLTELKWGRLEGSSVVPQIRIMTEAGATLDLPLSPAFVHSKYHVFNGCVGENAVPYHPLAAYLDHGLVIAFAYEIAGGKVRPYVPSANDQSEVALKRYMKLGGGTAEGNTERWFNNMCDGGFMAGPNLAKSTPGGTRDVTVFPPRVVVALSLATMRERSDYEPGGIVGMARLYPHVMVRSNVKLKRIDAATKLTRPVKTEALDNGNGTVHGTCCGAHTEIKSLLVADANEDPYGDNNAYRPFWSGMFSYYEVDPDRRLGKQRLHMVRRDRPGVRTVYDCGERDLSGTVQKFTSIAKNPRQGEFDNLHLAPRLQLKAAFITYPTAEVVGARSVRTVQHYEPIAAGPMKLDPIAMAPFCSHDCLHMHWRWLSAGARSSKGWGAGASPYTVQAATMIPINHDLDMIMNGPNSVTLVEHAFPTANVGENRSKTIAADSVQFFFHPGLAYAQGIVSWRESMMAQFWSFLASGRAGATSWQFADSSRKVLGIEHPPVLYWNLRYYAAKGAKGWEARPWIAQLKHPTIEITRGEVDRARDA